VKVEATVWAWTTPSSDHLDLYYAANAASPAWTLIGTLNPTAAGAQVLSATYSLPTGAQQAVRAHFRYNGSAAACGTGAYDDHDDLVFAVTSTAPPPDFTVSASPASLTVAQGASGTSTATIGSVNGFASAVSLSCTGLPAGVTCAFSPASVTPPANGAATSALTVLVGATTATGTYALTVAGTSGATHSTPVSLTVTSPGGGAQAAVYDATLKAPKCAAVGSSCDSGTSLLLGRDAKGPEPNQPNAVNSTCADGTSGAFHSDESNDRIKVSTVDGTPFAAGKTVRIDATVWAWTTPSADHLDLYYAANAASPAWTFLATLNPTAAGAQTLSTTYTLPTGPLQAVRAQFRYQGSASACTSGNYNDRDDLIFAVP
jgi:leucyl aminopeptidase